MGSPTFVFKKVETFPLTVEIDCPLGKGKFVLDCKPKGSRKEAQDMLDSGISIDDLFADVVAAVHGAPDGNDGELEGQAALDFFSKGPVSNYTMPAFRDVYWEQFTDARRKNGQRLPRR
jgi:hypothetical protein